MNNVYTESVCVMCGKEERREGSHIGLPEFWYCVELTTGDEVFYYDVCNECGKDIREHISNTRKVDK